MDRVASIPHPPRHWSGVALWTAYECVKDDRLGGGACAPLLTETASLARHWMCGKPKLASPDGRWPENWLVQQANRGRPSTKALVCWRTLIRDCIVADIEVCQCHLDELKKSMLKLNQELVA